MSAADAELVDLGKSWIANERQQRAILYFAPQPHSVPVLQRLNALQAEEQVIIDRLRSLRAKTRAGLRVKAMVAMNYQPSPCVTEYEDLECELARAVFADLLGFASISPDDRETEAWWRSVGVEPDSIDDALAAEKLGGQP